MHISIVIVLEFNDWISMSISKEFLFLFNLKVINFIFSVPRVNWVHYFILETMVQLVLMLHISKLNSTQCSTAVPVQGQNVMIFLFVWSWWYTMVWQDDQNTTIYSFWLPDNPNILPQHNCFYYCDLNTRFRVSVTEKVEPEPMLGLAYWCSPIEAGCTSYRKNINLSNIRLSFQEKIFERKKYFVCLLSSDWGVRSV